MKCICPSSFSEGKTVDTPCVHCTSTTNVMIRKEVITFLTRRREEAEHREAFQNEWPIKIGVFGNRVIIK